MIALPLAEKIYSCCGNKFAWSNFFASKITACEFRFCLGTVLRNFGRNLASCVGQACGITVGGISDQTAVTKLGVASRCEVVATLDHLGRPERFRRPWLNPTLFQCLDHSGSGFGY